jgi:esterase/lipase superfamily enzyme
MMKHAAEAASVPATEIAGQRLGKGIADRVWMAGTLTLDDLYIIAVDKLRKDEIKHQRNQLEPEVSSSGLGSRLHPGVSQADEPVRYANHHSTSPFTRESRALIEF